MPGEQSHAITFKKPYKKKDLKATWDSKSESKEELDTAHLCFMANENTPKVTSESHLDECELSMNKLGKAFEELFNNYDFLKKKYLQMKKENEFLQNQIVYFSKKKKFYLPHFITHKRISMHIKFLLRLNFLLLKKMRFSH